MKPIGPLMWEHLTIERILSLFQAKSSWMQQENSIDLIFIDTSVDFMRTYADRTHHGKEEEILFRDLYRKKLSPEHARMMTELIEDHKYTRTLTGRLVEVKEKYVNGDKAALRDVVSCLKALAEFYPPHIEKEDKHFFFSIMDYFSKEE